jgi:hypothetical protein
MADGIVKPMVKLTVASIRYIDAAILTIIMRLALCLYSTRDHDEGFGLPCGSAVPTPAQL